jgi:hypothetical protein
MAAGFPVTAPDVNAQAGRLVVAVWKALDDVRLFNAWLNDSAHNDAYLIALGIVQADADAIQASFADLDALRQIAHGTGTQGVATIGSSAAANNFFFNAKNLSGLTNVTV